MDAYIRASPRIASRCGVFAALLIWHRRARDLRHGGRALHLESHHHLADRRGDLLHRRRDLRRQPLCADDARPRQRRRIADLFRPARALSGLRWSRGLLAFAFCGRDCSFFDALLVRGLFGKTGIPNTVWRARLWVPYAAMPIGLGLLVLQYLGELVSLVTGPRAALRPLGKADAEEFRARARAKRWEARDEPDHPRLDRSRRHAGDAVVGHPGRLRSGRDFDRLSFAVPRLRQHARRSPRHSGRASTNSPWSPSRCS